MPKNKNTHRQYIKAVIKNKSKPGKKLDLNKIDVPIMSVAIETAIDKPKLKSRLKKFTKKQHKRELAAVAERALWLCCTISEVRQWLINGNRSLRRLALKSAKRRLASEQYDALEELLKKPGATSDATLIDPGILISAFKQLAESFAAEGVDGKIEFALVTIIDGKFETSDHNTELDLCSIKASTRRIVSRMSSNYFGVVEMALFNSHTHPGGGRVISTHTHVLIWGEGVKARAQKVAELLSYTISPNITGAKPIVVKSVDPDPVNLARIAAYLLKAPHKCKTFYPGSEGKPGNTHHSRKGDRLVRYLRLTEIRSMLTFKDITFASGQGLAVRSGIAKSLSLLAQEQARKAPRRFHPAEIPSFWGTLKVSMGTTRFNHPIIKRTK